MDPVHLYEEIENAAREEILECGGSLSHHHGVGRVRAHFLGRVVSPAAMGVLGALKRHLDPRGVFAARHLMPDTTSKL